MADVIVDFRGFEELQKRIAELNSSTMEEAKRQSMKEMAAVYLAEAKRNTPTRGTEVRQVSENEYKNSRVAEYSKVKDFNKHKKLYSSDAKVAYKHKGERKFKMLHNSEHMRRSWNAGTVEREGREYKVKVFNIASYASYVNDGHRQQPGRYVPILGKRLVKNWVDGLNMAEKAEKETERKAKNILRRNINRVLLRYST